jgi:hypothetical protein
VEIGFDKHLSASESLLIYQNFIEKALKITILIISLQKIFLNPLRVAASPYLTCRTHSLVELIK